MSSTRLTFRSLRSESFRHLAGALLVFCAALAYALSLLLSVKGQMPSADSNYHYLAAREIWQGPTPFPDPGKSFPLTLLNVLKVDHYYGYHLLIAPAGAIASPELGMKVASALLFALFLTTLYGVLRAQRVPYAPAWTFLSIAFSSQDWRYLQLRGGQLMAALCLVFIHIAFFTEAAKKRRWLLFIVAYASMLSYHGAVVLLPFHIAGLAALLLTSKTPADRARWFEPAITALGLVAGLLVNPYMNLRFATFRFAALHIFHMGTDSARLFAGRENVEFNPFPISHLWIEVSWGILLWGLLAGLGFIGYRLLTKRPVAREIVVFAALTALSIVLTARAVRMREYGVPIAFVFLALLVRPKGVRVSLMRSLGGALAVVVSASLYDQWHHTRDLMLREKPLNFYEGAAAVIEASHGAPVLNLTQSDAMSLTWELPSARVVQALSPYFIYLHDRGLYEDIKRLRLGGTAASTTEALARFQQRGVRLVAVSQHKHMNVFAAEHPDLLRLAYEHPLHHTRIYDLAPYMSPASPATK
jgi:hypothetical protein